MSLAMFMVIQRVLQYTMVLSRIKWKCKYCRGKLNIKVSNKDKCSFLTTVHRF